MKKFLSLILSLILIANTSLAVFACEVDPDCTCDCEDCITEECECLCHQPAPIYGADLGEDGDDRAPKK